MASPLERSESSWFRRNATALNDRRVTILFAGPQFQLEGILRDLNVIAGITSHEPRTLGRLIGRCLIEMQCEPFALSAECPDWLRSVVRPGAPLETAAALAQLMEASFAYLQYSGFELKRVARAMSASLSMDLAENRAALADIVNKPYPHEWHFTAEHPLAAVEAAPRDTIILYEPLETDPEQDLGAEWFECPPRFAMTPAERATLAEAVRARPHIVREQIQDDTEPRASASMVDMARRIQITTNLPGMHPAYHAPEKRWNKPKSKRTRPAPQKEPTA